MAIRLSQEGKSRIPLQNTAWYRKNHITFSDVLGYVRLAILKKKYYTKFGLKPKLGSQLQNSLSCTNSMILA